MALHTRAGEVEFSFEVPVTAVRDRMVYRDQTYEYVGTQDGVAHFRKVS